MPPKMISRKQGPLPEGTPPLEELQSPLSGQLAALKASQDKLFSELSPNAKTCFTSIVELDRYAALVDEKDGLIVEAKKDLAVGVEQLQMTVRAADEVARTLADPVDDGTGKPPEAVPSPAKNVKAVLRDMSYAARKVVHLLESLANFEKEVAYLEPRVIDDGNLPDFEALKDNEKAGDVAKLDEAASAFASGRKPDELDATEPSIQSNRRTIEEDGDLKPIKWKASFEMSDTVIAPSEDNAKFVVAMRIKSRKDLAESIKVSREQ